MAIKARTDHLVKTVLRYPQRFLEWFILFALAVFIILTMLAERLAIDRKVLIKDSLHLLDEQAMSVNQVLPKTHSGCTSNSTQTIARLVRNAKIIEKYDIFEAPLNDSTIRLPSYDYDEIFYNAYLKGHESIIYDCETIYRPGGSESGPWNPYNGRIKASQFNQAKQVDKAVVISMFWAERYYHWLIESFLRLSLVRDWLVANPDVKIIINTPTRDELYELYEMIGLNKTRFITTATANIFKISTALVPTATAGGRLIPRAANMIRAEFRRVLAKRFPSSNTGVVNIVLQSRGSGSRHIVNHDQLLQGIISRFTDSNVEVYDQSDPLERLMLLHYHADLLIGPHGAGLSNSVFLRKGAGMFEIYMKHGMMGEKDWFNPCYEIQAGRLGLDYATIRAESGDHGSPMEVDVEKVLNAVEPLYQRQREALFNNSRSNK